MLLFLLAGLFGGICGLVSAILVGHRHSSDLSLQSLSVRELIIQDTSGNATIRLYAGDYGPVMAFFDPATHRDAIQIAVSGGSRRINFLTADGDSVATLASTNPSRASTLVLGDDRLRRRVILGAHHSDIDVPDGNTESVSEWGLTLRNPHQITQDIARLLVLDHSNEQAPRVITLLPKNK